MCAFLCDPGTSQTERFQEQHLKKCCKRADATTCKMQSFTVVKCTSLKLRIHPLEKATSLEHFFKNVMASQEEKPLHTN